MPKILLVDDDPDILKVCKSVLVMAKHEVSIANDVISAMEKLEEEPFDAIISDYNMPGSTGFDLIRTVRSNPKFDHLAISMLTSRRDRENIELALKLGVDDYIVKPLEPEIFLSKVENLFHKKTPVERVSLDFEKIGKVVKAHFQISSTIQTFSEHGMTLISSVPYQEGERIDVQTQVFSEIPIEAPIMKVTSCSQAKPGQWSVRVNFCGTTEKTLIAIRMWLFRQQINYKKMGNHAKGA